MDAADATMMDTNAVVDPADAALNPDAAEPAESPEVDDADAADADEGEAEEAAAAAPAGGRWGKGGHRAAQKLPIYNPLWSPLDLPSLRRRLCDPQLAPRRNAHLVQEGDSVIAYESRISMSPLVIKRGSVYGNRFGNFHHADMIGLPLGSRVAARGKTKGWIVLLPFAPDLWTNSLTHRTQILYQADIAYILFQLDLKPGDVVFESGTGSGSLTTALATTVRPHGHVHTFEFNADRVKKAKVDFENNKLSDVITVRERDVVGTGFPLVEGGVNAVFLDLPAPWSVVESAHRALKHQARLCSFSPCIEQVQRTCLRLDELGFSEIVTVEILLRSFEVQGHTTFPVAKPSATGTFHAKRQQQATTGDAAGSAAAAAPAVAAAASAPAAAPSTDSRKRPLDSDAAEAEPAEKKVKLEDGSAAAGEARADEAASAASAPAPPVTTSAAPVVAASTTPAAPRPQLPVTLVTTKPYQLMRGHTGYLTFAVCNKY